MPSTKATQRCHLLACDRTNTVMQALNASTATAHAHSPFGQHDRARPVLPSTGFNGQYLEPDGSYLLGNGYRTYRPQLMRFTRPDSLSPFGAGGLNGYLYCGADPINRNDPSGHDWEDFAGGALIGLGILGMLLGGYRAKFAQRPIGARRLIAGGGAAVAFGALAIAAPDDQMKLGSVVGGAIVLGIAAAGGMMGSSLLGKTKVSSKSALDLSDEALRRRINKINWKVNGLQPPLPEGSLGRSSTSSAATSGRRSSQLSLTPDQMANFTAQAEIDIAVSRNAHFASVAGNSAFLRSQKLPVRQP